MADELQCSAGIYTTYGSQAKFELAFELASECSQIPSDLSWRSPADQWPQPDELLEAKISQIGSFEHDQLEDPGDEISSGLDTCSVADEEVEPTGAGSTTISKVVSAAGALLQRSAEQKGDCACDEVYDSEGEWDGVDLTAFIQRWVEYAEVSDTEVILAMIYIDRIALHTGTPICFRSVHRLVLGCLLLATKWREETAFRMTWYASVGGTSREDLLELEVRIAQDLDWHFAVGSEELCTYKGNLLGWHTE